MFQHNQNLSKSKQFNKIFVFNYGSMQVIIFKNAFSLYAEIFINNDFCKQMENINWDYYYNNMLLKMIQNIRLHFITITYDISSVLSHDHPMLI